MARALMAWRERVCDGRYILSLCGRNERARAYLKYKQADNRSRWKYLNIRTQSFIFLSRLEGHDMVRGRTNKSRV